MEDKYSVLDIALTEAKKWVNEIDDRPVSSKLTFDELKEKFKFPLNNSSIPAEDVVKHIIDSAKDGLLGCAGGRFFARANPNKKDLTKGIELADSWATDAHKWLNVPFDCGIAFG